MGIPEELVREILVRLPAKSLMRFKSVERSWNDLFGTPSFIKNHHTQMQMQMQMRNENLLIISHPDNQDNCCFTLISDSSLSESQFDIHYIFPELQTLISVLEIILYGHCNGVLCLYVIVRGGDQIRPNKLILWNPAIRDVKLIPPPPHLPSHSSIYGFGVDPISNDLKLVFLNWEWASQSSFLNPPIVEIYNLTTDSWTPIRNRDGNRGGNDNDNDTILIDSIHQLDPDPKTYLVNGVCYWLKALRSEGFFLSFDFRDNRFRKIKTPPTLSSFLDFVTEVNGSLAYVVNCSLNYDYFKYELWIMEEDRWTKLYNVGPFDLEVYPWGIWRNGTEFLGGSPDGTLVSYNSYGQSVRRFQIPSPVCLHAAGYVESIAPLSF